VSFRRAQMVCMKAEPRVCRDRSRRGLEHAGDYTFRRLQQRIDVGLGVSVGDVIALEVEGQLEDAMVEQLPPVAEEHVDVIAEKVVVALDRKLQEVGNENGAEPRDDRRHAEPVIKSL